MLVSPAEGFGHWAESYDDWPNPLVALEERVLADMSIVTGQRFLDAGTGTGRWLKRAILAGARVCGVDGSEPMLRVAAGDARLSGRLVRGDLRVLPFADDSFDLAVCSLALGYIDRPDAALSELARVSSRIVLSELHGAAVAAGWTRSFRARGERYEIAHYQHHPEELQRIMSDAGFSGDWFREATFGAPEREIFEAAGKGSNFEQLARTPALFAMSWTRQCA